LCLFLITDQLMPITKQEDGTWQSECEGGDLQFKL
jgi:hypothetical protein